MAYFAVGEGKRTIVVNTSAIFEGWRFSVLDGDTGYGYGTVDDMKHAVRLVAVDDGNSGTVSDDFDFVGAVDIQVPGQVFVVPGISVQKIGPGG